MLLYLCGSYLGAMFVYLGCECSGRALDLHAQRTELFHRQLAGELTTHHSSVCMFISLGVYKPFHFQRCLPYIKRIVRCLMYVLSFWRMYAMLNVTCKGRGKNIQQVKQETPGYLYKQLELVKLINFNHTTLKNSKSIYKNPQLQWAEISVKSLHAR